MSTLTSLALPWPYLHVAIPIGSSQWGQAGGCASLAGLVG